MARTTTQISVTIDKVLVAIAEDKLLPSGMLNLPKGSFSQLFTELLTRWIVENSDGKDFMELYAEYKEKM